jgi:hypothetical protein
MPGVQRNAMRYLLILLTLPMAATPFATINCGIEYQATISGQITPAACEPTLYLSSRADFVLEPGRLTASFSLFAMGHVTDSEWVDPPEPPTNWVYFRGDLYASNEITIVVRGGTGQGKLTGSRSASSESIIGASWLADSEEYPVFSELTYTSNFLPLDVQGLPLFFPHEVPFTFDIPFTLSMSGILTFESAKFAYRSIGYEKLFQAETHLSRILDANGALMPGARIELVQTPEPGTVLLLAAGLAALTLRAVSRKSARA